MPRFVEGPAIETAFSSGDETAHVHERAINFCHDRRDTSAAEQSPPEQPPPSQMRAENTCLYALARDDAGKTIGARQRVAARPHRAHTHACNRHAPRDWMMAETNNDESSFGAHSATLRTYTHRHTEIYTSNATFRERLRHAACMRQTMYTHVHISRGRRCPADENSTGIARRDAFSEIYAVVAGIFREGHVSWFGAKKENEFGAYFLISLPYMLKPIEARSTESRN